MVRIFIALLALMALAVSAAEPTWQGIVDPSFKTLQVQRDDDPLGLPVITLDGRDRIVISFDELTDERSWLRYELVHCDWDWRPSGLVDPEFLDGFNYADVDDWDFSRATILHYVHYEIAIPNEQMAPKLPGNYVVRVYRDDDPDLTLLRARFMVTDGSLGVRASASPRTDIDYMKTHQQVTIQVDRREAPVDNMYADLRVVVVPNATPSEAVTVTSPNRLQGSTAVYDHVRDLIFNGGNEYRRMETVSTIYKPMHVESIEWPSEQGEPYTMYLALDQQRADDPYLYDQTQKGRYVVREYNSTQSHVEADYVDVVFTLDGPQRREKIWLDGDFTERRLDDTALMEWDPATNVYRKSLLLKQGHYNYRYLTPARPGAVEGNHYETQNEYAVYVYYRPRGGRYDILGGVTTAEY